MKEKIKDVEHFGLLEIIAIVFIMWVTFIISNIWWVLL